ncbi:MAG: hypothetical protein ACLGIJ_08915 [Candidatus Limnocylindria bacterium]
MSGRSGSTRADSGYILPAFDRLAPPPAPALIAARVEAHTGPGDVVVDLAGRGGWVARGAVDRQRRAVSIESSPLTRMLAEVVLRPPDVRHLDAAFQGMAASPRGESSLKVSLGDLYATRCATCGRMLVADAVTWALPSEKGGDPDAAGAAVPTRRHYRCVVCRDQRGGAELRDAPLDPEDVARAVARTGYDEALAWARDRFPTVDGAPRLVDELLDLHVPRQLVALVGIMERIETDLRAAPVLAALRLAMLHALLPSTRLASGTGRVATLRVQGGHVRLPAGGVWHERNPWSAFEDGFRLVRGFVQRLEGGLVGPVQARLGEDLRALGEGTATAVLANASPSAIRTIGDGRAGDPRVRLVLGQPALRPDLDRLALAYHGTAWTLGREAAGLLPVDALASPALRSPWSWQAVALGRSLTAVAPAMARDGRLVQFVDGGPDALAAVVIGAASAGFRLVAARLAEPGDDAPSVVEAIPPGAALPPGPRTRANVGLPPVADGPGDPDLVPGPGLFAPPERFDRRPFSEYEARRIVTEAAVETLRARGEPARFERLFGEVLVALDRSGHLRRLAVGSMSAPATTDAGDPADAGAAARDDRSGAEPSSDAGRAADPGSDVGADGPARSGPARGTTRAVGSGSAIAGTVASSGVDAAGRPDPVERLVRLIRDEFSRPGQVRLREIEPGRWWLGDQADQETAAPPLADRVEWSVFSLLSTGGPLNEAAFFERIATLYTGHDLPDETLVRACLASYRSRTGSADRLATADDLLRRSQEHAELIARLVDAGHRLGMRVWIGEREQGRRHGRGTLGDLLDERERQAYLGSIARPVDDLAEVDVIWYVRGKVALLFEVEWTAILGETLLRRHARLGPNDRLVRFLAIAPERTELVRHKLERSPLLRAAMDGGGWNVIKWDHLRTFLAMDPPDLAALEPLLGLDPLVERSGEQMPLFGGGSGPAVP